MGARHLLGTLVLARDEVTGELSFKRVTAQHLSDYGQIVTVSIRDLETGEAQHIRSNAAHPYFAKRAEGTPLLVSSQGHTYQGPITWGGWVDAENLVPGDLLLNPDGTWAEVTGVASNETPLTAYNITVEDFRTYFVAANMDAVPVWVHNCPIDPDDVTPINPEKIVAPPDKPGNAPIGDDGKPIELHHEKGANGPLTVMTQEEHRRGENYRKNHPDDHPKLTPEERRQFNKDRRQYWKEKYFR